MLPLPPAYTLLSREPPPNSELVRAHRTLEAVQALGVEVRWRAEEGLQRADFTRLVHEAQRQRHAAKANRAELEAVMIVCPLDVDGVAVGEGAGPERATTRLDDDVVIWGDGVADLEGGDHVVGGQVLLQTEDRRFAGLAGTLVEVAVQREPISVSCASARVASIAVAAVPTSRSERSDCNMRYPSDLGGGGRADCRWPGGGRKRPVQSVSGIVAQSFGLAVPPLYSDSSIGSLFGTLGPNCPFFLTGLAGHDYRGR